jgi:hypothetical protein
MKAERDIFMVDSGEETMVMEEKWPEAIPTAVPLPILHLQQRRKQFIYLFTILPPSIAK